MTPRRRIGSDEARTWARRLPLNDALAKGLMAAVCCYVGDTGIATVSLESLSEDSDQSVATVRRRLRWLEDLGVLSLLPRWIDADGRVNYEGRGRQVCSDIKLNLDVDLFDLAMRTGADKKAPHVGEVSDEIRGSQQQPLNPDARGSCQQPLNPIRGSSVGVPLESPPIGSESSSEEIPTPKPPSVPEAVPLAPQQAPAPVEAPQAGIQGEQATPPDPDLEPEWLEFRAGYPDGIVELDKARAEFTSLPKPDRRKAIEGEALYAARCKRRGDKPMKAHLFLRKRVWEGLSVSGAGSSRFVPASSAEGAAVRVMWALAGLSPPLANHCGTQGYWCLFELTPQVLGLAAAPMPRGIAPPPTCWPEFEAGRAQHVRWQEIVQKSIGRGVQVNRDNKIRAPWPWPPRIDGSRSDEPQQGSTGPPGLGEISEAEAEEFADSMK